MKKSPRDTWKTQYRLISVACNGPLWQSIGWKIFLCQNQLMIHVLVHFQQVLKKTIKSQWRLVENNPEGFEVLQYRLRLAASEHPLVIDFEKIFFFLQMYIRIHLPINFGDSSWKMKFWHFLKLFGYFLVSLEAFLDKFLQIWPLNLSLWVSRSISWKFQRKSSIDAQDW